MIQKQIKVPTKHWSRDSHSKPRKQPPKRVSGFAWLPLLMSGVVISLLGGALWFVYNTGFEAGKTESALTVQEAQDRARDVRNEFIAKRTAQYEKAVQEANKEAGKYLKELQETRIINDNLKEALSKPPEIEIRYRECVYTDEDHQYTLDLYKELSDG